MSNETSCVHYVERFSRETSSQFNLPHERAEARLSGELSPFHMDKETFVSKGIMHFNKIRNLTVEQLREPLNRVEEAYESTDEMVFSEEQGFWDDFEGNYVFDLDSLLEFEVEVYEVIQVMHAYFTDADPDQFKELLMQQWDERRQVKEVGNHDKESD
jgi:hypothetical protein